MKNLGKTLKEIVNDKSIPQEIQDYLGFLNIETSFEEYGDDIEDVFGGYFYLCETPEDLKAVKTTTEGEKGYLSIHDTADSFDQCDWIENCRPERIEGNKNFVVVLLCSTNAGGNTFFIPKGLVTENVLKSIKLTKQMWSNPGDSDADHS